MNGKLVLAFLLTIITIFSNALANPVSNDFQTIDISKMHSEPVNPLHLSCKIVCKNTETGKVCGNDGKTYEDIGYITCRQMCGANIFKAHDGECNDELENEKRTSDNA